MLNWFAAQANQYTQMAKIGFSYVKFNAEFDESSVFYLKAAKSAQKMAKTKVVRENVNWRCSEPNV